MKISFLTSAINVVSAGAQVLSRLGLRLKSVWNSISVPLEQKPLLRRIVLLALSVAGAVALFLLVWPWRPEASCDTRVDYYPMQTLLNDNHSTWSQLFVAPFFRARSNTTILAQETKPVFVVAMRLWGLLWRTWISDQPQPHAKEYMAFMAFTCWLLMIAIWRVGRRLANGWIATATIGVTLFCPWHLVLMYFPAYSQFSMALYLAAFLLVLKADRLSVFLGGVVGSLALLSNASLLVYLFGLGLLVGFMRLPDWRRALDRGILFGLGLVFVFAVLEILVRTPLVHGLFPSATAVDSQVVLLAKYFHRSLYHNQFGRVDVAKYPLMMLFILKHNSWAAVLLFVVMPFVFVWEMARRGAKQCLEPGLLRTVVLLGLPAFIAVLSADLRPGVQLGRTYFIAYPFLVMAFLVLLNEMGTRQAAWRWIAAGLVFLYVAETVYGLVDERRAFHAVSEFMNAEFSKGNRVAQFRNTGHTRAVSMLADNDGGLGRHDDALRVELLTEDSQLPDVVRGKLVIVDGLEPKLLDPSVSYVLTTPQTRSIWPWAWQAPGWTLRGEFKWTSSGLGPVVPVPRKDLPFFCLYPLLIFEDELQTWRYIDREFREDSYKDGFVASAVWRLSPDSIPSSDRKKKHWQWFLETPADNRYYFKDEAPRQGLGAVTAWKLYQGYVSRGDVNGDDWLDYLIFDTHASDQAVLWVSLSGPSGLSEPTPWLRFGRSLPEQVRYADVNGDGMIDVLYSELRPDGGVWVSLSTRTGFTQPAKWVEYSGFAPDQFSFADVNGDGRADVIHYDSTGSGVIRVGLSKGTGFYAPVDWGRVGQGSVTQMKYADVNGDKRGDALYLDTSDPAVAVLRILLSTGLSFREAASLKLGERVVPEGLNFADMSADGAADLLYFDTSRDDAGVLYVGVSTGTGFSPLQAVWGTPGKCSPDQINLTDVSRDGTVDVVFYDTRQQTLSMVMVDGLNMTPPMPCRDVAVVSPLVR